ncbi:MAG: hypothetical protein V3U92_10990 [Cellulophaga sp.]
MRQPSILLFTILISCLTYSQQSEINKLTEEYYNSLFYKISSNIKNTNIVAVIKDDKLTLKTEQKTDMAFGNQSIGKGTINASKGFCHDLIIMIYDTEEKRQYFKQNELKMIVFDWTYVDRYYEKQKARFTLSNSDFLSLGFPFLEYEFVDKLKKE